MTDQHVEITHSRERCPAPSPKRKYANTPWVCPLCGQAYLATRQQPGNIAPTALSWWWRKWPFTGPSYRYEEAPNG